MEWDTNTISTISFDFSAVAAGIYIENAFYNSKYKDSISRLKREAKASVNVDKRYDNTTASYMFLAGRKDLDRINNDKEQLKKEINELIDGLKELDKEIAKADKKIKANIKKHGDEVYKAIDIKSLCNFERLHKVFYHDEIVDIINNYVKIDNMKKLGFDNIKYIFKSLDYDATGINQDKLDFLYKKTRDEFIQYIGNVKDKDLFEESFRPAIIKEAEQITGMPKDFIQDITNKFDSIRVLYNIKNSE